MGDPRRLFEAKDMAGAVLYAKRIASDTADAYPILVNEDGSLIVSLTSGTVSLDTTGLANSAGQTTHTTALQAIQSAVEGVLDVTPSTTASTITNAAGNPVPVSLTNTAVTVTNSVSTLSLLSKTLTGSSGSINVTNATITVTPSAGNKIKVYAFSLTTTSTTGVICVFNSGGVANGLELWRDLLQAPSGANAGANLSVAPPGFLFQSRSGTAVSLSLSTAVIVHYSISYFEEP